MGIRPIEQAVSAALCHEGWSTHDLRNRRRPDVEDRPFREICSGVASPMLGCIGVGVVPFGSTAHNEAIPRPTSGLVGSPMCRVILRPSSGPPGLSADQLPQPWAALPVGMGWSICDPPVGPLLAPELFWALWPKACLQAHCGRYGLQIRDIGQGSPQADADESRSCPI